MSEIKSVLLLKLVICLGLLASCTSNVAQGADAHDGWISADATLELVGEPHLLSLPSFLTGRGSFYQQGTTGAYAVSIKTRRDPAAIITLKQREPIRTILIKNRRDYERRKGLAIWLSDDKQNWRRVWKAETVEAAWKVDLPEGTQARDAKQRLEAFASRNNPESLEKLAHRLFRALDENAPGEFLHRHT